MTWGHGPSVYRIPAGFGIAGPNTYTVSSFYRLNRVHDTAVSLSLWQQEYANFRNSATTSYQIGDQLGGLEYFSLVEMPVGDWQ